MLNDQVQCEINEIKSKQLALDIRAWDLLAILYNTHLMRCAISISMSVDL